MRIYLIGFMGAGKSTMGRLAAASFDVPFFDTDQIIESQTGMSIMDVFDTQGEDYFRHIEADVLHQTTFYPKSINATGGGLPTYEDNMNWMNKHGITIYLEWPDEILMGRLLDLKASRPLLSKLASDEAEGKMKELLLQRKPVYEQSAITLEMNGEEEEDYILLEKACRYIW